MIKPLLHVASVRSSRFYDPYVPGIAFSLVQSLDSGVEAYVTPEIETIGVFFQILLYRTCRVSACLQMGGTARL